MLTFDRFFDFRLDADSSGNGLGAIDIIKPSPFAQLIAPVTAMTAPISYNETTQGDLSDDPNNTITLNLGEGSNVVTASQDGNPRDIDYFTIVVPEGHELTGLFVDNYTAAVGNPAFIGVQRGGSFTEGPSGADPSQLLGGLVYGSSDVGTDILDDIGGDARFQGFTGPLEAGTYTFWLNQTGGESTVSLDFQIAALEVSTDIVGTDGNDVLLGTDDNDVIFGNAGNDRIEGGLGDDIIDGGAGNDTFIAGAGADQIDGGGGFDTIRFVESQNGGVRVNLQSGTGLDNDAQGDSYVSIERVIGTRLRDQLTGSDGADIFLGRGGRDIIDGGAGNDILDGEFGRDEITGGAGDDTLLGGESNDTFFGGLGSDSHDGESGIRDTVSYRGSTSVIVNLEDGTGSGGFAEGDTYVNIERIEGSFRNDIIIGDAGRNFLNSLSGDDLINGGAGNDRISAGGGNDILVGGTGNDVLIGGDGLDAFIFQDNEVGRDVVQDFTDGEDILDFSELSTFNSVADVLAAAVQNGDDVVITLDANSSITLFDVDIAVLDDADFNFIPGGV